MTPVQQLEDLANDVEACGMACEFDNIERRRFFSITARIRKVVKELSTTTDASPKGDGK